MACLWAVEEHYVIRRDVKLIDSDKIAVEKLINNDTENLVDSVAKADLFQTNIINYFGRILPTINDPDETVLAKYTINRSFELKKIMLKAFFRFTGKLYTPVMPKTHISIPALEELNDTTIVLTLKDTESKQIVCQICLRILENLAKLFHFFVPEEDSKELAQKATIEYDIEPVKAPLPGDPLFEELKSCNNSRVIE